LRDPYGLRRAAQGVIRILVDLPELTGLDLRLTLADLVTPSSQQTASAGQAAPDPAFWSFNSGGVQNVSNQYAAMPSVHIAWATWCALALGPRLKNKTAATLAWCYPVVTLVVIVITANHYFLDAVAGLVILGIGWFVANRVTRAGRGAPVASAVRNARVWGKRQNALERAVNRVTPASIAPLLRSLANLDALSKGIGRGNAWDALTDAALALCGKPTVVPV
jgi:hypothetical protein